MGLFPVFTIIVYVDKANFRGLKNTKKTGNYAVKIPRNVPKRIFI